MKKLLLLLLCLTMCLLAFSGCSSSGNKQSTAPQTTEEPHNVPTAFFEVEVLPSNLSSEENQNYEHYIDQYCIEQTWNILISTSENINSFNFIELDESEDLLIVQTLYTYYTDEHEKPLILHTYINDATCNRGISYVNESGKVTYMGIVCDMNSGNVRLEELEVGVIPDGTYAPQITDSLYHGNDNNIFDKYFSNYLLNENITAWSHIGISVDKYLDPDNKGYTNFDIYRTAHTDGSCVEYYAVPYTEKQLEIVYKFQSDDSMVPIWIKPVT